MMELNPTILRSPLCPWALRRMFWGFLLTNLPISGPKFSIGSVHVQLTSACLGWFIVASSLTFILELSPRINRMRWMVFIFAAASLFKLRPDIDIVTQWPVYLIASLFVVLEARIIWELCGLVRSVAATLGDSALATKAHRRRKAFVICLVGFLLLFPALNHLPEPTIPFVAPVLVGVYITVACFILGLMRSAEEICLSHSHEPTGPLISPGDPGAAMPA